VPDGDFVNPRTFEIAACGAFQLVDGRSLLGELFSDEEMVKFSDLHDLRDKIDYYLQRPEKRAEFAEKGRRRVLAEHTYEKRMEELLALIVADNGKLREKLILHRQESCRLHEGIDTQEGLRELLAALPQGSAPTLDGIYSALTGGEGRLSRAEKIFFALKNVELKL
jgi:spore maturation protein CgeB